MHETFETSGDGSPEAPQGGSSRVARGVGWAIAVLWLVGLGGYAAWQLVAADGPLLPKMLVFGAWTGFGLLLLSVLLDRLKAMKTDPYREVQK